MNRKLEGDDHPEVAGISVRLGELLLRKGDYTVAEQVLRDALVIYQRRFGLGDRRVVFPLTLLVTVLKKQGRDEEASKYAAELVEMHRRLAEQPDATAPELNKYAWSLLTSEVSELRDPEVALPLALEANELTDHKNPAYLDTLSLAYHLTGDTAKAIENQKKAIALLPPGESTLRTPLETALADFEAALKDEKLPTEQEAVASDQPGQSSSDEKQDE